MGAKAAPHGPADRVEEEGASPLSLARAVEEEGEESGNSEFSWNSGFLPNWKIKGMCFWTFLLAIQREF